MRIIELGGAGPEMPERIATFARELGLAGRQMGRPSPKKLHWHFSRAGQKGTLEITWLPSENRTWIGVHANREGDWIDDAIDRLLLLNDPMIQ